MKRIFITGITVVFALVSCTKIEINEGNFISMEKHGNEVVLQSSVSSKSICLNAVEEVFSTEDIKDVMCIKSLSKIRAKDAFVSICRLQDDKQTKEIKNFTVYDMKVSAALVLPYEDEKGMGKIIGIPFDFIRQTPRLNEVSNVSDICFDVSANVVEVGYDGLEYEFEITIKEEKEQVGQFVIRKILPLKMQEIDFDAFVGEFN